MEERENLYAGLLGALHEAVICFDPEWSVLTLNPSAREMFRIQNGDVIGNQLLPLLCGEDRQAVAEVSGFLKSVLGRDRDGSNLEVLLTRQDGSTFTAELAVSRVAMGESWIGAVVIRDTSAEKRHELALTKALQQLEESNRKLRELNRERNEFIGVAAHDLRTPLHRVTLALDLLEDPDVPDEKKDRFFEMIRRAARGMKRLIDDLLSMTKLSSGTLELKERVVKVEDFIEEVLDFQSELARQRKITLVPKVEIGESTVSFDPERIQQVVNNLLSNAFKYSPEGSEVELVINSGSDQFTVSVQDHGAGIPEDEQKKLFEPFARLSPKPVRGETSTGLGLVICKQIVELHKGEIGFESREGEGSRFWFQIPRR